MREEVRGVVMSGFFQRICELVTVGIMVDEK